MTALHTPELCLVALMGVSGSGKSTFATEKFAPFEAVSSDFCRGLVSGNPNDQTATSDAFAILHSIVATRLKRGLLTVVDATNTTREARKEIVELAKEHDVLPVAIVLDIEPEIAISRNQQRPDRAFGAGPINRQHGQLRKALKKLHKEGFRVVHVLKSPEEAEQAEIVRDRLYNNKKDLRGPFDVIGDVHGCLPELVELLEKLGYRIVRNTDKQPIDAVHPDGRTVVFVGDLVDRGPDTVGVLRLAMGITGNGHALAVPGNHEARLIRALDGANIQATHGLDQTLTKLEKEPPQFRQQVRDWCYSLISHLVLDEGKLVIAHAGLPQAYHGRASTRVRSFALYGDTTGETDEFGLPVRYPWAEDYRGKATVIYGHTPTSTLNWVNNTLCVDTGCVFGGKLTAFRYPEREIEQVDAHETYCEPIRPLASTSERPDQELRLSDVVGTRYVETGQMGRIKILAELAGGALEVMSRFAIHPEYVPYLPPTMSPVATSSLPDYLEHPLEAFTYFKDSGIDQVVCEEKHMGSRAVVMLSPDRAAVYTRTGRAFFEPALEKEFLSRMTAAAQQAGLFNEFQSDWLLFDAELLPWSLKADSLVRDCFAAPGIAGKASIAATKAALMSAADRGLDVGELLGRVQDQSEAIDGYNRAWRHYVWPTEGLEGVQIAPFQLLAAEGANFSDRDHLWHLDVADRLAEVDPQLVRKTRRKVVCVGDGESVEAGVSWWMALTEAGGEGMVVKPLVNLARDEKNRLVQPGLKVRGREYLRLIYGPDYLAEKNLSRLKNRNLSKKRSLALREYALGLEAIDRLVKKEPLWRIHEAVFSVLALESEPVDPRL
ncbi:polynucleotide kinase-phosphatase [Actinomycetaceae bacterium WB03_NA08]|uniref:Polynucleotide kinase-phosphatase n=1 Tax=Scrofimicrobium canadense TaxID=2652290 RepID=A0A6N7W7R8_9ACTO|nr:polynucleotide kinase-phosphatase [Scrofimicrobium canadense]MSS85441.1 polynucleotide kinase-phosphatase [Scrofimicrobium canadense]